MPRRRGRLRRPADECAALVAERCSSAWSETTTSPCSASSTISSFSPAAAAAVRWTRETAKPETIDFLRGLEPADESREVALYHASPRDPVWEYVLWPDQAAECIAVQAARVSLVGHSHVALFFVMPGDGDRRRGQAAELDDAAKGAQAGAGTRLDLAEGRWLVNPGSVGQPRDGDPRAAWLELDTRCLAGDLPPGRLRHRPRRRGDHRHRPARAPGQAALRGAVTAGERAMDGRDRLTRLAAMPGTSDSSALLALVGRGRGACRLRLERRLKRQDPGDQRRSAERRPERRPARGRRRTTASTASAERRGVRRRRERAAGDRRRRPKAALRDAGANLATLVSEQCPADRGDRAKRRPADADSSSTPTTTAPAPTTTTTEHDHHARPRRADDHRRATATAARTAGRRKRQRQVGGGKPGGGEPGGGGDGGTGGGRAAPVAEADERDADLRPLRARRPARLRRDVERLQGDRPGPRAHRRGEDPRRAPLRRREVRRPLPPRGARGREADPPEHRPGLRHRASTTTATTSSWSTSRAARAPSSSRRAGRLGPETAVEIGIQSCAGLDYAHRQGIIHRDVKPGNLMVIGGPAARGNAGATAHEPPTGEMTVKLTDFGIARAAEQTRLTQVGSVVGTAAYLAPEQARGEEATPASDVYALGVVHLPAPDRAPALGGIDARRARDPPRERAPAAAHLLRPRRSRRRSRPRCCARWRATRRGRYSTARQLAGGASRRRSPARSRRRPTARRRRDALMPGEHDRATAAARAGEPVDAGRPPGARARAGARAAARRPARRAPAPRRSAAKRLGSAHRHPAGDRDPRRGDRRRSSC